MGQVELAIRQQFMAQSHEVGNSGFVIGRHRFRQL
jgi:hypothetical protein